MVQCCAGLLVGGSMVLAVKSYCFVLRLQMSSQNECSKRGRAEVDNSPLPSQLELKVLCGATSLAVAGSGTYDFDK